MAISNMDVWKLALAKIGNTNFPIAETDQTTEAIVCSVEYPQIRDEAFIKVKPKFATKRYNAALKPATVTGWDYVYALPSDYLCPLGIADSMGRFIPLQLRELYDIETDGSASVLLTNISGAELIYVARIAEVQRWDPLFVNAVVYGLATALALSIKKDANLAMALSREYDKKLGEASGLAFISQNMGRPPESSIIRSRD